ncbi:MAG: precorrin-6y C5,15-methyltransferase (decarboxylating) subunit CbiE [Actinomycetota bacterium]|nr:precorrin-6y C5,15-methyltransferase (decarboxylating) subunit CbiE [Actinomycetota bacterium]
MDTAEHPAQVSIVGLHGGQWFGPAAERALNRANVLYGSRRQLELLPDAVSGQRVELWGQIDRMLELAEARSDVGESVCILASGDPGFFGLVRMASARLGPARLSVHPAPSSVSLAFARIGDNWDDAVVASVHGRPLAPAIETILHHPKVAVLVSMDQPPEVLGQALLVAKCAPRLVAVCSQLGTPDESRWHGDLDGLASGRFDPLSVVIFQSPHAEGSSHAGLTWGTAAEAFSHRDGLITRGEVRAVVLGKLSLPAAGVLWDIGAGSGSVAVECSRLCPGLRVFAVERRPEDIARLTANSAGTGVVPIHGSAPQALADLPDPDRAFVGGGGIEVLDAALSRLRPGGTLVATYAAVGRADAAADRLGSMVQIAVARGTPVGPDASWRLQAENPVFVCWGPRR